MWSTVANHGRISSPGVDGTVPVGCVPAPSAADIAARLYVSRNTVKSHAAAIYRKLDTNSRAEAVDRLRRAGLLTET